MLGPDGGIVAASRQLLLIKNADETRAPEMPRPMLYDLR